MAEFGLQAIEHDVRDQLGIVTTYLPHLTERGMLQETAIERVEEALDEARRFLGESSGEPDLAGQVSAVLSRYEGEADSRTELDMLEETSPYPSIDRTIANLLENAEEHTGASVIGVYGGRDEDTVSLSVEDDGPGVDQELRRDIFRPERRGERSSGSGMGTFIAECLVRENGGTLAVGDSERHGGAKFTLTLPVDPSPTDVKDS